MQPLGEPAGQAHHRVGLGLGVGGEAAGGGDERLAAQQSLVAATTRAFELSDALFRSGGAGYLDVLDAQRSLYTVQQSLISLQLIEQANRITLYRTLGGGWRTTADEAQVTGSGTAPV